MVQDGGCELNYKKVCCSTRGWGREEQPSKSPLPLALLFGFSHVWKCPIFPAAAVSHASQGPRTAERLVQGSGAGDAETGDVLGKQA